jgi:hypothetical protein
MTVEGYRDIVEMVYEACEARALRGVAMAPEYGRELLRQFGDVLLPTEYGKYIEGLALAIMGDDDED